MNLRPRTLSLAGTALVAIALLVFGLALLYVRFTPKTYAASTKVIIRPKSPQSAPFKFDDLRLDLFKHDRDITIIDLRNTYVFEIKASASEPGAAADLANQRTRELEEAVRSRTKADISIIEQAEPNPNPVRPVSRKILMISGVAALNVGLVGVICLIVSFLKSRLPGALEAFPPTTA